MFFKNAVLLAMMLVLLAAAGFAADNYTFNFLRNDVSARASALGGSFITMSNDPNLIFYNPAGLGTLSGRKASFGYFKNLLDINSGHASYATEIQGLGFIGAGVTYTNYGSFQETDATGQQTGTFGANEAAFSMGYGNKLQENLFYGAAAKFIYSNIAGYSSTGAAIDLGVHYVALPGRIILGASVANLGTQFNPYISTRENLPLDVKVGMRLMPEHLPAILLFEIHKINDAQDKFVSHLNAFTIGMEYSASENFCLRFGYNNQQRQDYKILSGSGLAGISLGAGLMAQPYTFDYSFNSMGSIGALHRVTVGIGF
ncbi:MAG: type IX secretion system protein PorQ [Bacteroidota bacterium]